MALHKIKIESREQWLQERKSSCGGSDVGALLGVNQYRSMYSVWAEKTGRLPETETNEAMRQGTDLEDYVAQRFSELSGWKVQRQNFLVRNDDYPHLHATIDRKIVGQRAGLECKTASPYSDDKFTADEFPSSYYAQCVAYMAVCNLKEYYLAALILGRRFVVYHLYTEEGTVTPDWCECGIHVKRSEFEGVREIVKSFWRYIDEDEDPPVDGTDATTEALNAVYDDPMVDDVELFGTEAVCDKLAETEAQIKALEKEKTELQNQLKVALGDASTGYNKRYTVKWKAAGRTNTDYKQLLADHPEIDVTKYQTTTTSRRFSYKAIKGV